MGTLRSLAVFLILLFLTSRSYSASILRMDLYEKIKKETGVSLREAFQAAEGKNRNAIIDLQIYAKRVGIKEIEKSFDEEIAHRERYCKKKRSLSCNESVQDLRGQIEFIRDLHIKSETLESSKKLYYCLIIYHFNIKLKVLATDLLDWDKTCSAQEKINTKICQEKLFETHVLADVARDISQIALLKSEKEGQSPEMLKSIADRISRYEKL